MNFVSRSQWGARPARSTSPIGPVRGVAVHWEGPHMGTPDHSRCANAVRGIQRFHLDTRGWADIAYNFVVCPHGSIFEGRGWGRRSAANGTNDGNEHYHAVCYLGGQGDPFTDAAKGAYVELVAESRRRWPAGSEVRPHSSFKATDCPGDVIRAWLGTDPFAAAVPIPQPQQEVKPMFGPFDIRGVVASAKDPQTGGVWLLGEDGAVFAFEGARGVRGVNGMGFFAGRRAARFDRDANGFAVAPEGKILVIIDTSGATYHLPFS